MHAIVTREFNGRPDDEALARKIAVGELIVGDLARVALASGDAMLEADAKAKADEEAKAKAEADAKGKSGKKD